MVSCAPNEIKLVRARKRKPSVLCPVSALQRFASRQALGLEPAAGHEPCRMVETTSSG
jgi:hypothetical protein